MIRRSRVVIVICPSLEDTVRAIEPRRAIGADRERARLRRRARNRGRRRRGPSCALGFGRGHAARALHRDVRGVPGARPAVRGDGASFVAARPDARLVLAGGQARSGRARHATQARAAGIGGVTIFAGERPASEIPAYLLAADVLVSPRSRGTNTPLKIYQYLRSGQADRRDAAADAHAGARRRHGVPHRRDRRRIRRRHPRGARRSGAGRSGRAQRAAARRNEVQLRGVSRPHARRPAPRSKARAAWRGREGPGVTRARRSKDHYSYTVYADPATARAFDEPPLRRPDRRARRQLAGARARRTCSAPIQDRRILDVGTGTGRAACCWRAAAPGHRRRRVGADARGRAAARRGRAVDDHVRRAATPTRCEFPTAASTSRSACAC